MSETSDMFDGTVTVAYSAKDRHRAAEWYARVLGFQLLYDNPEVGWCEMKTPVEGVTVGFADAESPKVEGGATMTWGVRDIAKARAELEAADVRFDGETQEVPGLVKIVTFYDPDGNHHMLAETLAQD